MAQVEVLAELVRGQRVHLQRTRASSQEVGPATSQLAGAGPGEREAPTLLLDQSVHFVEDGRHLLHFVDHDPALMARRNHAFEPFRTREQARGGVGLEQIYDYGAL